MYLYIIYGRNAMISNVIAKISVCLFVCLSNIHQIIKLKRKVSNYDVLCLLSSANFIKLL